MSQAAFRPASVQARGGSNAPAIVLLASVASVTALLSLHTLGHLKDVLIYRSLRGQEVGWRTLVAALRWEDVVLAAVAVALAAAIVRAEWRTRAYTRLLAAASPREALWILAVVAAWLGHAYAGPGVLLGGDTATHISRFLEVSRGLQAGALAQWTNYQYAGAPLLWFTGPLTYVAGGLLTFLTGSALFSAKALLLVLHLGSALLFFAFLRRLGFRPSGAMLASAGFAGSFAHLHLFLYRGVVPQAFTIVFLVLLFHAADGLLRGRGARAGNFTLFALSVAGLIVNHQPHALFAAVYLALFAMPMLALRVWQPAGLPIILAAGTLGVLTSAVATLPVLAEAGWVMIEPDSALFRFQLPSASRIMHLLAWNNTRTTWGIDYWAYLGLGTIGFLCAGTLAALRGRVQGAMRAAGLGALSCLPLCLVMYNPVVRDIIFLLFFACLLAAVGLEWVLSAGLLRSWALLAVGVIVLADLMSTSVQPVARNDKGFLIEAGRHLERVAPGDRVMEVNVSAAGELSADIGPDASPVSYFATVQRIAGNHNMAATRLHNFLVTTAKMAEADLRTQGKLSAEVAALLGLFNVRRVVCHSSIANGCPASIQSNADDPVLGRHLSIPATPLVFSTRLEALPRQTEFEKPMLWVEDFDSAESRPRIEWIAGFQRLFVRTENADLMRRTAGAIAVMDACDPCTSVNAQPTAPVIHHYGVELDRVKIAVEVRQPGFLQLSHPWFPSTTVTVNGVPVRPIRGALDLMIVPVEAGMSVIELREAITPVRRLALALSGGGLLLMALGAGLIARADRPTRPAPSPPA